MCAQDCMNAPLLSLPHLPSSEHAPDTAEDVCDGCQSDMSTTPSPGPGAPLCSIGEDSGERVPSVSSLDSDGSVRLDGQVPYAPDVDADVCAACALTYAAAAASLGALACSVAFAAGSCCARVGGRMRAACLSGAAGPYVP